MPTDFVSGNRFKYEKVKAILGDVEQLDIDLPEIQNRDAKNIITEKLREALKHKKGALLWKTPLFIWIV